MDTSRWERFGAASGIVFVGLMIAAFTIVPAEPRLSEVNEFAAYAADNRTGLLTQALLATFAIMFLLWFAGNVRSHIQRNEGSSGRLASVGFGGAVAAAVLSAVGATMYAALALRANTAPDPAIVGVLADIGTLAYTMAFAPLAVWIGATAVSSYRSGAFPTWFAIGSGALAAVFAAVPAVIYGDRGFFSIDEWLAPAVAFTGMLVWVLATSVMLIVGEAVKAEPSAEQPHEHWHLRRVVGQ